MVEQISDVVHVKWEMVDAPPANIGGVQGKYFTGVFKTEDRLIGILDVEKVLEESE
jgi:purine-binding chemotaxis protein CheW